MSNATNSAPARITTWNGGLADTEGTAVDTTWEEWFETLSAPAGPFRGDFRHPGWSAGVFEPCRRKAEHCVGMSALVLDYDRGYPIQDVLAHWEDYYGLLHTTRKHTAEAPRFRVVLPLARVVTPDEYDVIWAWAADVARTAGHEVDHAASDVSRFWFTPGGKTFECHRLTGAVLDPEPILASAAAPSPPSGGNVLPFERVDDATRVERRVIAYLAKMPGAVAGQRGHEDAWRAALAVVRGFALDQETAFRLLWQHYNPRCQPPWSEKELRHKVQSAERDGRTEWGGKLQTMPPRAVPGGTGTDGPAPLSAPVSRPVFKLGDHVELAAATLRALETSPITYDEGSVWRYVPEFGVWQKIPDEALEATVATFSGCWIETGEKFKPLGISASACQGVARLVKNTLSTRPGRHVFAGATSGIAFRNGFVTVRDGAVSVLAHSHEHMARAGLPFDYDPMLPHPKLDAFFDDIFEGCGDKQQRVELIQEFVGASLLGMATQFQRCLVLYGTGSNGKSQVVDIMRSVFPDGTTTALSPQHWEERFRLQMLVGARANFVSEMPGKEIANSEIFKSVVVGDEMTAERKNKDAFDFSPRAGHMFAANRMPSTSDISAGFFRRYVILPLTKVYPDSGPGVVRSIGRSIALEERQAIASWVVQGAARAQARGGYVAPAASASVLHEWKLDSDSVAMFLNENYQPSESYEPSKTVYSHYTDWCKETGFKPVHIGTFSKQLVTLGYRKSMVHGRSNYYLVRVR